MYLVTEGKRKRPLYIKNQNGEVYQSYFVKNGLHFCEGYHLELESSVVEQSHSREDLL